MTEASNPALLDTFDETHLDELLADYLDAELCKVVNSVPSNTAPKQDIVAELLGCCRVKRNGDELEGFLPLINVSINVKEHPRTFLAIARISMFGGYFRDKGEHGDQSDGVEENNEDGTRSLVEMGWKTLFQEIPKLLLETVPGDFVTRGVLVSSILQQNHQMDHQREGTQFDRLRTGWQQIHYLACDGLPMGVPERIKRINEVYQIIWQETAQVIQRYLECQTIIDEDDHHPYMHIDSDWLISWLTSNVLLSTQLRRHYNLEKDSPLSGSSVISPVTKMRYMMYLSHLILYVIHCARHYTRRQIFKDIEKDKYYKGYQRPPFADVPTGPLLNRSRSQVYILSEYAYREIGVHRELRIFERLVRQLEYELPLYAASNSYRDHLYHVMDVCLLGELLLRSNICGYEDEIQPYTLAKYIADLMVESSASSMDVNERVVLENWYVAALFHDLGYVVEQAEKFLTPIEVINGDGLDNFALHAKRGLESGREAIAKVLQRGFALQDQDLSEYLKKIRATDHGIVGWLHLNHLLKDLDGQPQRLSPALLAILRHNLSDQKIRVKQEPISMLLMFCDHVQEWGRPRVGADPLAQAVMEALRFSELAALKQKIRVHDLRIGGLEPIISTTADHQECGRCPMAGESCINCMRVCTQIKDDKLICRLPHIDSREGDFEPGISWLLFCRDLQCLDFGREWPFQMEIKLEHTPPRLWSILPWRPLEMDLLEEYANSQAQAAYLCEWIDFARHPEKEMGIAYENDEGKLGGIGKETFTITLTSLKKPLKRALPDEVWKNFYKWKWKWLGQKLLNTSLGSWPDTD